ncbi:uncharacterized protein LOC101777117 [Setaria italica]|uniref:uncharacterized protein LOC101777117 n=1 Tax=Setaria italica TaxID=4555 RepID=UPI000647F65F|nr:uncharacterized protein LOC101777117 [Setaria italica]
MAPSSSVSNPLLDVQIIEKLSKSKYTLWKVQVLTAIRGVRMEGYITNKIGTPPSEIDDKLPDGKITKVPNLAYEEWYARDQQVLGLIFSSMGKDALVQIATAKMAAQAWQEVKSMFTAQTRARSVNVRLALTTTKKGALSIIEYYAKMKGFADEMAASVKPLDDEELIAYIVNGLDLEFNPVVSALVTRVELISFTELYSQLLSFENQLELQDGSGSSVNNISKGSCGSSGGRGGGNCGHGPRRGGRGGFGHGCGNQNQPCTNQHQHRSSGSSSNICPLCQVCFKKGHLSSDCWLRYNDTYIPDKRLVATAYNNTYSVDTNLYTDTGAMNHVTSELEKLSFHDKYKGGEHIHTESGAGMEIKHVGHSIVPTHSRDLYLKNILHVPQATKNLVFVHRLTKDNSSFLEFHPDYFLIKDQSMKNTILRGRCHKGLYPLPSVRPMK